MKILKYPHPALFTKCERVSVFGKELTTLLDGMWKVLKDNYAVGLAANQVGLKYRMFVMEGTDGERINLVNPYIVTRSVAPAMKKEGCLSAPGEFLIISDRAEWVQVSFQDETGNSHTRVFKGLQSVCVQHEIDHLEGKSHLQSKSIPKAKRKDLSKKWGV